MKLLSFFELWSKIRAGDSKARRPISSSAIQEKTNDLAESRFNKGTIAGDEPDYGGVELTETPLGLLQSQQIEKLFASKYENRNYILILLKKIPLFAGFLRSLNQAGSYLVRLARIQGVEIDVLQSLSTGFQFTGLALIILDFLRIPAIYFAAMLLGETLPVITLSKNVRWFYTAALLALTVTSLTVPVLAAPIAFALAGLTLGFSLVTMAKTIYQRYKIPRQLITINEKIEIEVEYLDGLHLDTVKLEALLQSRRTQLQITDQDSSFASWIQNENDELVRDLRAVSSAFDISLRELEALYATKLLYEEILKKHDTNMVIDKGVSVCVAAIALAGLTISLFLPPLGFGVLVSSALLGGGYIFSRMTFPLINKLFASIFGKKVTADVCEMPSTASPMALLSCMSIKENDVVQINYSESEKSPIMMGESCVGHVLKHGIFANKQLLEEPKIAVSITLGCV